MDNAEAEPVTDAEAVRVMVALGSELEWSGYTIHDFSVEEGVTYNPSIKPTLWRAQTCFATYNVYGPDNAVPPQWENYLLSVVVAKVAVAPPLIPSTAGRKQRKQMRKQQQGLPQIQDRGYTIACKSREEAMLIANRHAATQDRSELERRHQAL